MILSEVKERFEEHISEVEIITNRSIKCLITFITLLIAASVLVIAKNEGLPITILLLIFSLIDIALLYFLIKGREARYRGLEVTNILNIDFDRTELDDEEKERLMYNNLKSQQIY